MRTVAHPDSRLITASTTAASYERVSTLLQAEFGFSLGAQAKDAAQFAAGHGWYLPDHLRFVDGDERNASGAEWDLEGLNAMLAAAKRREFDVLIVPDVDRFARNMVKALVLEEQLQKYGVRVVYIRMPLENTPEGRLLKHQLFSIAEYEREKIRLRTHRGRREKAERGIVVGAGAAPYGYRYVRSGLKNKVVGLEPDPRTAPIVQRIFTEALTRSYQDILNDLDAEGIAPPRKRWTPTTISGIVTSPTYAGHFIYGAGRRRDRNEAFSEGSEGLTSARVPALVSRDQWDAVQRATTRRKTVRRGRMPKEQDPYTLRGLLTCGHCGGLLSTGYANGGHRYYECLRSQPHIAIPAGWRPCTMRLMHAESTEEYVWNTVAGALLDPEQLRKGLEVAQARHGETLARRKDRSEALEREIDRERARLNRIVDEMLDAAKGSETYRALAERKQKSEDLLRRLRAERVAFEAEPTEGVSPDAALEIEQFAAEVRDGIHLATNAERRWVYEKLQLTARVTVSPEGDKIGRHHYAIEFSAVLPICDSVSTPS